MKKKNLLIMIMSLLILLVGCSKKEDVKSEGGELDNKKIKIGVLQFVEHVSLDAAQEGFKDQLEESGYDVEWVMENANGDISLTTTIPEKLKSDKVDLIYAIATPSAQGIKNTITDIPAVFSAVTDPVGAGIVETIEKPGGNMTGVSDYINPASQIESFLAIFPNVKTFGVIYNTGEQNSVVQVEELESTLSDMNIKLEKVGISTINDIPQAIASLSSKIDALFALTDNTVASAAPIVAENLRKYNLPSLSAEEGQVKNGLLMSEGVDYYEHGKQAGRLAIKILSGEEAAKLSVEYNEKNDKKLNKETEETLNLDLNSEKLKEMTLVE